MKILCVGKTAHDSMRLLRPSQHQEWRARVELAIYTLSTTGLFGDPVDEYWRYQISSFMPRYPFVRRADLSGLPL